MDIVYVNKNNLENNSEELQLSLRSIKNLPHDKVYIVGEVPEWAKNVIHVDVPQNTNKQDNVRRNLETAIKHADISDDFILMNDDFFVMKPVTVSELDVNMGYMKDVIAKYDQRYPEGTEYIASMKKLFEMLINKGYENPISFELHVPMIINRKRAQDFLKYLNGDRMYQFRSYYGNFAGLSGQTINDVKVFIDNVHNDDDYIRHPEQYLQSQKLLSATGGSFSKSIVGPFIRNIFTVKSEYEV